MIGYLEGTILNREEDSILLNVKGVGYEVNCSQNTLNALLAQDLVQLWIHTNVREDAIELYGFAKRTEKELFLSLIKVNGIGPKMAIKVLSAAPFDNLVAMIENGDVARLTKLPRIGKKTAEQIILSLKGKLVLDDERTTKTQFAARAEVVSALVNLGFKISDVEHIVNKMDPTIDLQRGIREGLAALTAQF